MGSTIDELRERMTHREFAYWCVVFRKRPFDDEHMFHLGPALVRRDIRGTFGGKSQPPLDKFLPFRRGEKRDDIDEQIISQFEDK